MDQLGSSLALAYIEDVDLLTTVSHMLHDYCRFAWVVHDIYYVCPHTAHVHFDTLVPMPRPDLSCCREEKSERCYVTDYKWWTQLVRNVDLVCTN